MQSQNNILKERKMNPYVLAFICIIMIIAAQALLKYGVNVYEDTGGIHLIGSQFWDGIRKIVTSWQIIVAIFLYASSALLWLEVLSQIPLSIAYPMVSISYAGAVIVGRFMFKEPISALHIVGIVLICCGVIALVRSQ
jgi:multidrug transporter EmrE-like cation transporter